MGFASSDVGFLLLNITPSPELVGWGGRRRHGGSLSPAPPPSRPPEAARRHGGSCRWKPMPLLQPRLCFLSPHRNHWCFPPLFLNSNLLCNHQSFKLPMFAGLVITKQQFLGNLVKEFSPPKQKKRSYAYLFNSIWKLGVESKFLDATFFSSGFICKPFWGWRILWNVFKKFPACLERGHWTLSFFLMLRGRLVAGTWWGLGWEHGSDCWAFHPVFLDFLNCFFYFFLSPLHNYLLMLAVCLFVFLNFFYKIP